MNAEWNGSWARKVVPAGYEHGVLTLAGTSALLMKSGDADRESETFRAYYLLGQKRGKSLDDEARLRELEWQLALYYDVEIGPYIPARNVVELLRSAATKWKKGEEIKRSLAVIDSRIPLVYEGPTDPVDLYAEGFKSLLMVANSGPRAGRVVRCRPAFEAWSLVVEIAWDPEDLDFDFLGLVVERTQKYGLGDGRAIGFGAFVAKLERGPLAKEGANGDPTKLRNAMYERAHVAHRDRIVRGATTRPKKAGV